LTIDTSQNVTFVGSQTLSAGTANGVLYLNGSKAATSGSALVFDGTNLGVGVTPNAWENAGPGQTALQTMSWALSNDVNSHYQTNNAYYGSAAWRYRASKSATRYDQDSSAGQHKWFNAPSGTAGNVITFTQAMTLDASGNLGLGVTPSAWVNFKALESTAGNSVYFGSSQASLGSNIYNDGAGWRYKTTAPAGVFNNVQGTYYWFQAPSGTAGNSVGLTQAMTLQASGALSVGSASDPGANNVLINAYDGGNGKGIFLRPGFYTTDQPSITVQDHNGGASDGLRLGGYDGISFYIGAIAGEAARITSGGSFNVGAYGSISPSTYGWDLTNSSFTYLGIFQGANALFFLGSSYTGQPRFQPATDNYYDIGFASGRFKTIYAATGTINTSDANEKQDIDALSDAELRVATAIKSLIKKFRFKDAVVKKGNEARIHVGVMAQDVAAAFVAEGLDPSKYALFCSDTWYAVDGKALDEDARPYTAETEGAVEVTRLGVRYDELLAFVIAAL
jgi:hypothetical protein